MNKLFLTNSALLIVFMGFQQWLICNSDMQLAEYNIDLWQISVRLPAIFAVLSLLVPLIMLKRKHLRLSTKAEKVAAWVVTPLLFFGLTSSCVCLPYNWRPANLAGPAQIHHLNFVPRV